MAKPIIAIDIDDTIADSTEALRRRVNDRFGVDLALNDYRIKADYWGYYESVWSLHGLADRARHDDFAAEMVEDQSHVPLLPGALFAINILSKKYTIVLITARDKSWEDATKRWLSEQLRDTDVKIYFTTSHIDASGKTKGEICKLIGASVLIDDNPEHCVSAHKAGVETILFGNYGWHYKVPAYLVNCRDWQAVLAHLGVDNDR